jgi:hypothetical protein
MMRGMPRRHEYILHYATARPFAQYAVRVELSAKEREVLEERLAEMVEDGVLHHLDLSEADIVPVRLEEALAEVVDACRP